MKKILMLALTLGMTFSFAQDDDDFKVPERGGEGTVTVILDPPGSEVYLDGELIGKSPIEQMKFRSGRFDLLVIDQEQELVNTRFNVWPNQDNKYEGKTVMPFGNINVTLKGVKRCPLTINGEDAGVAEKMAPVLVKNLDAGDHMIKCGRFEGLINLPGETTVDVVVDAKTRSVYVKGSEQVK